MLKNMLAVVCFAVFCLGCSRNGIRVFNGGVPDGASHGRKIENFDKETCVSYGSDCDIRINGIIAVESVGSEVELKFCSDGMDLGTPFFVGSVSKQFAGVLALRYVSHLLESDVTVLLTEEEFISLINSRWEAEKLWNGLTLKHLAGTTVRDLLTNSSKIDYHSGENLGGYKYQNLNFDLVGLILEKQTGRPYSELAHELFREAGMADTFLHGDFPEEKLFQKLEKSLKLVNRDPAMMRNVLTKAMNSSGGIVSSARDLLRWNKFLGENGYFAKLTEFTSDNGYGMKYGFGLLTDSGKTFFLHDGCILFYYNGVCYAAILLHCNGINTVGFNVWETHRSKGAFSQSEAEKFLKETENDAIAEKYFRGLDLLFQKCIE